MTLQFVLCVILPSFIDALFFYYYFKKIGQSIFKNDFVWIDLPIVVGLFTLLSCYYWLYYILDGLFSRNDELVGARGYADFILLADELNYRIKHKINLNSDVIKRLPPKEYATWMYSNLKNNYNGALRESLLTTWLSDGINGRLPDYPQYGKGTPIRIAVGRCSPAFPIDGRITPAMFLRPDHGLLKGQKGLW